LRSFVAPSIGDRLGQKKAIILGGVSFLCYLIVIQIHNNYILLIFASINGFAT